MRRLLIMTILLFAIVILITSCKKDDSNTTVVPPPTNSGSTLCDGNGKTTYFPLDSANSWTFIYTLNNVTQTVVPNLYVNGYVMHGGVKYVDIQDKANWLYASHLIIREDTTNQNIYRYNTINYKEYLEVPSSPTLNQSWAISSGAVTRKVTNLSATLTTSSCSYKSLLQITEYNDTIVQGIYYYKKGLGMVALIVLGTNSSDYKLSTVKLK